MTDRIVWAKKYGFTDEVDCDAFDWLIFSYGGDWKEANLSGNSSWYNAVIRAQEMPERFISWKTAYRLGIRQVMNGIGDRTH